MSERAQLVLLAAAVVAVALVPVTAAYLQLGYHEDVRAGDDSAAVADARRALARGLATATADVSGSYTWENRDAAVATVRSNLSDALAAVRRSRRGGAFLAVAYNETAASTLATAVCPNGSNRRFGACLARDGVVVQERAGETHVVAVAVDLRVVSDRRDARATVVLRPPGRLTRVGNASRP